LKHAGAFGDEELEIAQILLMEEGGAREPFLALGRARVGEAADVAFARRHVAFAAMCARVHPHPYTRFNVDLLKLQLGAKCAGRELGLRALQSAAASGRLTLSSGLSSAATPKGAAINAAANISTQPLRNPPSHPHPDPRPTPPPKH